MAGLTPYRGAETPGEVSQFEKSPHPNPLPEGEGIGGGSDRFLRGDDALDEPGSRASLPVDDGDDPPAVPFDDRLTDDFVRLPVAAPRVSLVCQSGRPA